MSVYVSLDHTTLPTYAEFVHNAISGAKGMIVMSTVRLLPGFPAGTISQQFADASLNVNELRVIFPLAASQAGTVPDGYYSPILYLHRSPRESYEYEWDGHSLNYSLRQGIEQRVVKLYMPMDIAYPVIALGGKRNDVQNALFLLQQALSGSAQMPLYAPYSYDLERLATLYPDDQWFLDFKSALGHVSGGKIYGVGIEKSPLYTHAKVGASSNEVGIIFHANGADLKVRVLRNGKVQFMQFVDSHLLADRHPDLGRVWPLIVQVLQSVVTIGA